MDRLTARDKKNRMCHGKAACRVDKECCYAGCVNFQKIQNRLAEYEDTGLTPDEIKSFSCCTGVKAYEVFQKQNIWTYKKVKSLTINEAIAKGYKISINGVEV